MAIKAPFNISIIDPNEYILRRNCLPVTTHAIFEASTSRFHPDGFFSEVIFGEVGTNERLIKRGYIDLHTQVISPHLWKQLVSLKGYYQDICAGKTYAVYDKESKDLIRVNKNVPEGETGYSFFLRMLPKLHFMETDSLKRHEKISLLEYYKDRLLMDKLIVLPAGVRDVKMVDNRASPEKINNFYFSILSLSQALPKEISDNPLYDAIRYQMQMKIMGVYAYIVDLLDGKGGFAQAKYATRAIVYANRNVITSAPITKASSPVAENMMRADEIMVPLYQAMKAAEPLIINKLKTIFFDTVFGNQATKIAVIDPEKFSLQYVDVAISELKKYTTSDGIKTFIEDMRNKDLHFKPVCILPKDGFDKKYGPPYLQLVYDDGDTIYTFRDISDFMTYYTKQDQYAIKNADNLGKLEDFPEDHYCILGSTALSIFGMNHHNQDVDLIVSEDLLDKIKKSGEYVQLPNKVWQKKDKGIDIYNELILKEEKKDFKTYVKDNCIVVDGKFVVKPSHLLETYENSHRPKDVGKIKYLKGIVPDPKKIRPMVLAEMAYIATYSALKDRTCTMTRYPVLNMDGIQVHKMHLTTTNKSRIVTLKSLTDTGAEIRYPEYPVLDSTIKTTVSPHPSSLEVYGADFDGLGPQMKVCEGVAIVKRGN